METWWQFCVALLITLTLLIPLALLILWLSVRELAKAQATSAELAASTVNRVVSAHEAQTELLDKAIALLSTQDPMAFQALQVMNGHGQYTADDRYDPSDEAEADKMRAFGLVPGEEEGDRDGIGNTDEELEWFRAHGVPGFDR